MRDGSGRRRRVFDQSGQAAKLRSGKGEQGYINLDRVMDESGWSEQTLASLDLYIDRIALLRIGTNAQSTCEYRSPLAWQC